VLPIVTGLVEEALLRWLRAAELTCDRAALLVAQDPKVVISALMKLACGSPSFAAELNVDAFLQQVLGARDVRVWQTGRSGQAGATRHISNAFLLRGAGTVLRGASKLSSWLVPEECSDAGSVASVACNASEGD
jgi:Zn-dependent protease with chaperone function